MSNEASPSHRYTGVIPPRRQTTRAEEGTETAAPTPPDPGPPSAGEAALLDAQATLRRAQSEASPDPVSRAQFQAEADALGAQATRLRDPTALGMPELRLGQGGEVAPLPNDEMPAFLLQVAEAVHAPPSVLAAEASHDRLTLAREAGVLTLAVEAAESVGAKGAIEQMLAHGMAVTHSLSMRLAASATADLQLHELNRHGGGAPNALADAIRSATAVSRLGNTVARGALALDRLRNGGRQHVTVQHVTVAEGGQAVVAGNLGPGLGTSPKQRRMGGGGRS